MGNRLQTYSGEHDKWTDGAPGAYDYYYNGTNIAEDFTWLVVISTGPAMFIDFLSDGFGTSTGFNVSVNLRPESK